VRTSCPPTWKHRDELMIGFNFNGGILSRRLP
jgi:hypothetical protein